MQLEGQGLEEEAAAPKALLPRMKRLPAKRVVHLPQQGPDPLPFTLSFDASHPLPPGQDGPLLATHDVSGACPCTPSGIPATAASLLTPCNLDCSLPGER